MTEQEFIRKLPAIDEYYVIMCDFTKQPYAESDTETYDDKAFIIFEEKQALEMALKNRVGNPATDFTYTLPSGKKG